VLAEAVGRPVVDRRAQSPTANGRMRVDSYCVVAERRGELVKKAMMTVGKP
jgi:hypothetical protein